MVEHCHMQFSQITDGDGVIGRTEMDIVVNLCIQIDNYSFKFSKLNNGQEWQQ
jgi:hypothetical protein